MSLYAPAGEGNGAYTKGPIEDGTYSVVKADQHGATVHLGGSENSAFGPQGIVHITGAKGATGEVFIGAGVHSGRAKSGWTRGQDRWLYSNVYGRHAYDQFSCKVRSAQKRDSEE